MFGVSLGGGKNSLSCVLDVVLSCRLAFEMCGTAVQLVHMRGEGSLDSLRSNERDLANLIVALPLMMEAVGGRTDAYISSLSGSSSELWVSHSG